jgi:hypothetical protein
MQHQLRTYLFLGFATCTAIVSFIAVGPFKMNIDGDIYVSQVEQFEAGQITLTPYDVALRAFKPFPGVFGSLFTPIITPVEALQLLNLLFLFGLPFVAFKFLRELNFSPREATWGALWLITGYPLLKYGLAISTDIGSWFFALLSAYFVLKGIRTKSYREVILASLLGFIGGTVKEPGVFGLIFGGLYILFTYHSRNMRKTFAFLSALVFPALLLEITLFSVLMYAGFPSFFDWYGQVAHDDFIKENYQILKYVGVSLSSFSLLILYACVGLYGALRKYESIGKHTVAVILALLLASLPVLLWKIFISRVLYIQFLFFIPLGLIGTRVLLKYLSRYTVNVTWHVLVYVLPILCSVGLFILAQNRSLFTLFF